MKKMAKKLIALALAMVACGVRAEGVSEAQVRAALQVQSSAYSLRPMCDPNYLAKQEREVNGTISRGDFVNDSARANIRAGNVAACGLQAQAPLGPWADRAGRLLALSVLAATRVPGGMATPQTMSSGDRAVILLSFAAATGSTSAGEFLQALNASNYKTFQ